MKNTFGIQFWQLFFWCLLVIFHQYLAISDWLFSWPLERNSQQQTIENACQWRNPLPPYPFNNTPPFIILYMWYCILEALSQRDVKLTTESKIILGCTTCGLLCFSWMHSNDLKLKITGSKNGWLSCSDPAGHQLLLHHLCWWVWVRRPQLWVRGGWRQWHCLYSQGGTTS